eukprot:3470018-Pleurochrysis_carterae.AAC.3
MVLNSSSHAPSAKKKQNGAVRKCLRLASVYVVCTQPPRCRHRRQSELVLRGKRILSSLCNTIKNCWRGLVSATYCPFRRLTWRGRSRIKYLESSQGQVKAIAHRPKFG